MVTMLNAHLHPSNISTSSSPKGTQTKDKSASNKTDKQNYPETLWGFRLRLGALLVNVLSLPRIKGVTIHYLILRQNRKQNCSCNLITCCFPKIAVIQLLVASPRSNMHLHQSVTLSKRQVGPQSRRGKSGVCNGKCTPVILRSTTPVTSFQLRNTDMSWCVCMSTYSPQWRSPLPTRMARCLMCVVLIEFSSPNCPFCGYQSKWYDTAHEAIDETWNQWLIVTLPV